VLVTKEDLPKSTFEKTQKGLKKGGVKQPLFGGGEGLINPGCWPRVCMIQQMAWLLLF
jgi:hypothetical protein